MGMNRDEPTLQEAVTEVARVWWVVLVIGIIFTIFGVVMLFNVAAGATAIAIIVGAFLIFDGLVEMISGGRRGGSRGWAVVLGIVLVIGGIIVIAWPGVTFLVIAVVWGIVLLIGGIGRAVAAAMLRGYAWGWLVVLGIVEAIIGIVMLAWPHQTAYVILILIGIYSIVAGIIQIVLAFQLKKAPQRLAELSDGTIDIAF
ncbi:MAG: HdeD family acid-resistance protein [Acidimicrobiia bacterium]